MQAKDIAGQLAALTRTCVDVVTRDDLAARLREGRPLRVKLGIDPSGPLLHLGHAVVLRQLRAFQELGHEAILVVGDFTAQIGDPTGRVDARKPRTPAEIASDMKSYGEQAGLILDMRVTRVVYNSTWLAPLGLAEILRLCGTVTVAQMLERDDFSTRYAQGAPIGLHEFLYPLGVAYDSVVLDADVELGGTEQLFNLLMGRRLQESLRRTPQICMTSPILEGTDGVQRMGKSLNNFIALRDQPADMFGKVMSLPDALIERYFQLATELPQAEIAKRMALGPRDAKAALASAIVALYHGAEAASAATEHFERTVVNKELPDDVPSFRLADAEDGVSVARLLVLAGFAPSMREANRLVEQGAVRIDGVRVDDPRKTEQSWHGKVVQKGNHRFVRIEAAR
ncbi:MAG TPA: tyrosine--tRNA ligase [Candidatus Eremiobacteraceae bacterium]|nr:tyrosine--tRNA ligase [Candidatus Eremiobacteraceae bacterium]